MAASSRSQQNTSVFVRWRPLTGLEAQRGDAKIQRSHTIQENKKTTTEVQKLQDASLQLNENFRSAANKPQFSLRRNRVDFRGVGFDGVLEEGDDNETTFQTAIRPLLDNTVISDGGTASCFAYGQTGAGKTHTMLGYGEERGMIYRAAEHLFCTVDNYNENITQTMSEAGDAETTNSDDDKFVIYVRFAELYGENLFNLLDGRKQCQVLESRDGYVHMRYTHYDTETKRSRSSNINGVTCRSAQDIEEALKTGLAHRCVGVSSAHDQSSRSHGIIELQITTPRSLRNIAEVDTLDSELVYWRNLYDNSFLHGPQEGMTRSQLSQKVRQLELEISALKPRVEQEAQELKEMASFAFGKIVFCDLAGSEVQRSFVKISGEYVETGQQDKQTKEHLQQAIYINQSLSALAGCLRGLNDAKATRLPYRESRLTMILRQYLDGDNSGTVMLANVSPSVAYQNLTVQTLRYASLLVSAKNKKGGKRKRQPLRRKMKRNRRSESGEN